LVLSIKKRKRIKELAAFQVFQKLGIKERTSWFRVFEKQQTNHSFFFPVLWLLKKNLGAVWGAGAS
jgi:hypothetical protein